MQTNPLLIGFYIAITFVRFCQRNSLVLNFSRHEVINTICFCRSVGEELDSQAIILNNFGSEMDKSDNKMDFLSKRLTKLSHLTNGRLKIKIILVFFCLMRFWQKECFFKKSPEAFG